MAIFEPILARLNEAGGRYVVVGGLAVVLHGHARLTVDLDSSSTSLRTPHGAEPIEDPWASSTWEGNARWQLARTLAATPLQRLEWLEETLELAWAAGAIERRAPGDVAPPTSSPA
jgi:hypothetical protein